jgi:hypothetical protein
MGIFLEGSGRLGQRPKVSSFAGVKASVRLGKICASAVMGGLMQQAAMLVKATIPRTLIMISSARLTGRAIDSCIDFASEFQQADHGDRQRRSCRLPPELSVLA